MFNHDIFNMFGTTLEIFGTTNGNQWQCRLSSKAETLVAAFRGALDSLCLGAATSKTSKTLSRLQVEEKSEYCIICIICISFLFDLQCRVFLFRRKWWFMMIYDIDISAWFLRVPCSCGKSLGVWKQIWHPHGHRFTHMPSWAYRNGRRGSYQNCFAPPGLGVKMSCEIVRRKMKNQCI